MLRIWMLCTLWLVLPARGDAYLSGVNDIDPNIPHAIAEKLENAVVNYYKDPTPEKVDMVMDVIASTDLLSKRTAWPPLTAFLTTVFAANKDKVMRWISRNDYSNLAQDVILNALLHAQLNESASLFAQAHGWKGAELQEVKDFSAPVDLKTVVITLPGHIDMYWGAFFASGDVFYVDAIIDVLFNHTVANLPAEAHEKTKQLENERFHLAGRTLTDYAKTHPRVRAQIEKRIAEENDTTRADLLRKLIAPSAAK